MKLMDRYIAKEMIVPFIAGSVVIALLFAANQLIFILKTFTLQNVPLTAIVQMILYKMPFWLNMTLPAGISLAASLAVARLARESEITAMRACGVRVMRIIAPVAVFGLVVAVGNYYLVERVMPVTEKKANKLQIDVGIASASPSYQSNVWISLRQFWATFGSVQRTSEDKLEIHDIVLGQRPSGHSVTFISAPTGTYHNGIWTFRDIHGFTYDSRDDSFQVIPAKVMTVPQPIFIPDLFEAQMPELKTSQELVQAIKAGKTAGRDMVREEIQLQERYSIPAACIVFAIVAPIFAIVFARSGSFLGLLLSIFLVLLYYNAFVISTEIFGGKHWVSPWLAAWLPNFFFLAIGLLGVRRLE